MFISYLGQFKKAEAEWVMEVIDMYGGDVEAALLAVVSSLDRLTHRAEPVAELAAFDAAIRGACFASRDWWRIGMNRLVELGKVKLPGAP